MKARVLIASVFVVLAGSAAAQEPLETSGVINATLGGEQRVWHSVITKGPGVRVNTADWSHFDYGSEFYTFGISAYPGTDVTLDDVQTMEGRLELTFTVFGDLPTDCPCTVDASITYHSRDSITKDTYVNDEVPVTLTEFRPVDETRFAIAGNFEGTLAYVMDALADPNPANALEIAGSFEATMEPSGNQLAGN